MNKPLVTVHTVSVNPNKGTAQVAVAQAGRSKSFHVRMVEASKLSDREVWIAKNGTRFIRQDGAGFRLF